MPRYHRYQDIEKNLQETVLIPKKDLDGRGGNRLSLLAFHGTFIFALNLIKL